ncbi:hypothetical protein GKQ38_04785 [Candidatus Nanohaloarchaea archaeon]|nr:hypothetical protein GKQ38_04785 [Candidatus Nanohaloarchaea archaeon]
MVQWKGEISKEKSGRKAALLDQVSGLNVPNFFTLTKKDVETLVGDAQDPEQVLNTNLSSDIIDEIRSAYKQIGMSSEVREASGKAKSLVGGQRDTGRVAIRVSNDTRGIYDYKLNVGLSNIENALKKVISSYYRKNDSGSPAIIVQKMVEPGHTGAAINGYLGNYTLVESVEGLGISLEEGITSPETYLVGNNEVIDDNAPESQIKITRNPMNGQHRRKRTGGDSTSIPHSKITEMCEELADNNYSIKFVYKRGTFYVVDVFQTEKDYNPFESNKPSLNAVRVSPGKIEGRVGRDIRFSEQTHPPESYSKALIARKGGFTSTDAQKARKEGKPAIFNYSGELEEGQNLTVEEGSVEIQQSKGRRNSRGGNRSRRSTSREERPREDSSSPASLSETVSATEVLPIDGNGRSVHLSPPFGEGYSVGYSDREGAVSSEGYLTEYSEVFAFDGKKAVLDARKLSDRGLEEAVRYLDADLKILLVEQPDQGLVREAVRQRFDVIASQIDLDTLEKAVLREEKKFIMDNLAD